MACHKILIDYSEYVRLKNFEARYEQHSQSTNSSENQVGKGVVSTPLETPLVSVTDSITTPANAAVQGLHPTDLFKKVTTNKTETQQLSDGSEKKWYFLGIPKSD